MSGISRRGFLRAALNTILGGAIGITGVLKYIDFETTWFKLNRRRISIQGLPKVFNGIKLIHLSDFHFGDPITQDRVRDVVRMVNEQSPDLILITGDFIDSHTEEGLISGYFSILNGLKARLGLFAVLGNHDHWRNAPLVRQMLHESSIEGLYNQTVRINLGGEHLNLCGLDSYMEGLTDLGAVLSGLPDEETGILLVHEPDYADISAVTGRFSLQLSGHSHGGQIYIPLVGPPVTPEFGEKYPRGLYQIGSMYLYTTSGIGMVRPFVRFNCRPEVAEITLLTG